MFRAKLLLGRAEHVPMRSSVDGDVRDGSALELGVRASVTLTGQCVDCHPRPEVTFLKAEPRAARPELAGMTH
jgi:hypothetical protein